MNDPLLCVACHTAGKAPGLHAFRFDPRTGALRHLAAVSEGVTSPLYARADRAGRFLYVADNVADCDGEPGGAVAAYRIHADTGGLVFLNRRPAGGQVPCYLSLDPDGRFVLVAHYSSGSVSVRRAGPDGRLGELVATVAHPVPPDRKQANAHCVVLDHAARFALAADLGIDQVRVYRFDRASGRLECHDPPALCTARGAGPRHLAFHPGGRLVCCMTEYDNTLLTLRYEPQAGVLAIADIQPTLPPHFRATSYGADVHVHPEGRFVYVSNRGHESIAIFAIDPPTGRLTLVGHEPTQGQFPRGLALDPTGRFLLAANEHSDSIVCFRIDCRTGRLAPTGDVTRIAQPACPVFV